MSDWIPIEKEKPPIYKEVLLRSQLGSEELGGYLGHDDYYHKRYLVLGQCKPTHWKEVKV